MPPIFLKNHQWRQTPSSVIITVSLKANQKDVDLFIVNNYMKATSKPFIIELFFWGKVNSDESFCTLLENEVVFTIKKQEEETWPELEMQNLDKTSKQEIRDEAVKVAHSISDEKIKHIQEKRQKLQRESIQAQISLDSLTSNIVDNIRNSHRTNAMLELEDWKAKSESPILEEAENRVKLLSVDEMDNKYSKMESKNLQRIDHVIIDKENEVENDINSIEEDKKSYSLCIKNKNWWKQPEKIISNSQIKATNNPIFKEPKKNIVSLRKSGVISVKFSERVFPTPARESHHLEEQEWLEKQAEARRKIGFDAKDLKPEENNPQWLNDKGNDMYKNGNYLGAISAYSHGIRLSDKMVSLYVNRSAAQLAMGNYYRCMEDCTKALELMTPHCEANRTSRARCFARRGAALCKLSMCKEGIIELEEALKLLPNSTTLKEDLENAKEFYEKTQNENIEKND